MIDDNFDFLRLTVQKYGGTSVATPDRIRRAAERALARQRAGGRVVVVVSAMSGETNRLLALGHLISKRPEESPDLRELDALAATGEQVTATLTALAIRAAGGKARSFLAHQIRILTDTAFGNATIRGIETERLIDSLSAGEIPVVAGFQGVAPDGSVTTLGRNGSDTTAVAIAAALGAAVCEIYTDVPGVFTADPNVTPEAVKIPRISYAAMLAMAAQGAKVLHAPCVALAMRHRVPVHVLSAFTDEPGTWVVADPEGIVPERSCVERPQHGPHGACIGVTDLERKRHELVETGLHVG